MPRRIAHLDMDAFYASVELLRQPELRGLPVAIGGRGDSRTPEGRAALAVSRGVVTTASYEARVFGVRSGMALRRAMALCPSLIVLPVNFDAYRHYSRLFKAAVREVADCIEDRGIDEIYIDLSALPDDSTQIGHALKQRVYAATGLRCSIGIAPNKLLAKIASDLDKPDGLTLIDAADIPTRIWPLPVGRVNGIGPKAVEKLQALGVATIGELAGMPPHVLCKHFGSGYGRWLAEAAQGQDERAVETDQTPKSRSREITFPHDTRDQLTLYAVLVKLARQVADDLAKIGYAGQTVGIKLKFDDFETLTRDRRLPHPSKEFLTIRDAAADCLRRASIPRKLRLLGVRVGDLHPLSDIPTGQTGSLFDA